MKNGIYKEVLIRVTPNLTLLGKVKLKYTLSDFSYGEWIIFENNRPKYYLDIFEKAYEEIRNEIEGIMNFDLEKQIKMYNGDLSLVQNFIGISLKHKSYIEKLKLEKLPKSILIQIIKNK